KCALHFWDFPSEAPSDDESRPVANAQVVLLFSVSIRTLRADLWCIRVTIHLENDDSRDDRQPVRLLRRTPRKFRLRGCSLWLPADVQPCSRICIATPHAQVTGRTRNSFAIDLKAESQPTLSRTDERLEKRNRSILARQARAIRDIFASD